MYNSYNCKLYSRASYAMHTDHHHHSYESSKQNYSIQLSRTFSNDNIVLPSTENITATSLKNVTWLLCDCPGPQKRLFLPCIPYKMHPLRQVGYR